MTHRQVKIDKGRFSRNIQRLSWVNQLSAYLTALDSGPRILRLGSQRSSDDGPNTIGYGNNGTLDIYINPKPLNKEQNLPRCLDTSLVLSK